MRWAFVSDSIAVIPPRDGPGIPRLHSYCHCRRIASSDSGVLLVPAGLVLLLGVMVVVDGVDVVVRLVILFCQPLAAAALVDDSSSRKPPPAVDNSRPWPPPVPPVVAEPVVVGGTKWPWLPQRGVVLVVAAAVAEKVREELLWSEAAHDHGPDRTRPVAG
jgi:hypothetical protein